MSEAAEHGTSFWPAVAVGLYWAYLLMRHEWRQRSRFSRSFEREIAPAQSEGSHEPSRFLAVASKIAFNQGQFLAKAAEVYEFVLARYAAGDVAALAGLLSPTVLDTFTREVQLREARRETLRMDMVSLKPPQVVGKTFDDIAATIEVRFDADLFLIEGGDGGRKDSARLVHTSDIWTFRRDHRYTGPDWTLIATDGA